MKEEKRAKFYLFMNNDIKSNVSNRSALLDIYYEIDWEGFRPLSLPFLRSCGRLLCSACSSFTVPLQYLNWMISRVCGPCKVKLDAPTTVNLPRRSTSLGSLSSQGKICIIYYHFCMMNNYRKRIFAMLFCRNNTIFFHTWTQS